MIKCWFAKGRSNLVGAGGGEKNAPEEYGRSRHLQLKRSLMDLKRRTKLDRFCHRLISAPNSPSFLREKEDIFLPESLVDATIDMKLQC